MPRKYVKKPGVIQGSLYPRRPKGMTPTAQKEMGRYVVWETVRELGPVRMLDGSEAQVEPEERGVGKRGPKKGSKIQFVQVHRVFVDQHVPIPPREDWYPLRQARIVYPFNKLEVGHSFFVATTKYKGKSEMEVMLARMRSMAANHSARNHHTYYVGPHEDGIRVWRVA